MTLIITEFSRHGIVMVADSAVTHIMRNGKSEEYVTFDAKKLHVIPSMNAGLSIWGLGEIKDGDRPIPMDDWIRKFIENNGSKPIDDFAVLLTQTLQRLVGRGTYYTKMGVHIAAIIEPDRGGRPVFYHIRNCEFIPEREYYNYLNFTMENPEICNLQNCVPPWWWCNGGHIPSVCLSYALEAAFPRVNQLRGITIPSPSLEGRIAYRCAWVKFISDLYLSSGLKPTIGGKVSSLGIRPDGSLLVQ